MFTVGSSWSWRRATSYGLWSLERETIFFLRKFRFYYWPIMHQPIGGPFRKRTSGPFASSSRKKSRAPPPSTPSFLHSTSCGETDAPNNTICNLESARSTEEQRHQRWRWRHFDAGGVRPSSLPPPRLQPWLRATRPPPSRKIPIDLLLLPYRSASPYTTRSLEIRWACLRI
jgi:hypothetical protein